MELYRIFSWTLVTVGAVTLLWPLNIPLSALAYKVRIGQQPVPFEPRSFWLRCTFAALGLAVLTLLFLGVNALLVAGLELPPGPIQLILVVLYLPAAVWYLFWMYAFDDLLDALSQFLLYILLPGLPLLGAGWLFGWWGRLSQAAPWLLPLPPSP